MSKFWLRKARRVLIDIDTQFDLLTQHPDWKRDKCVKNMRRLMAWARHHKTNVISTVLSYRENETDDDGQPSWQNLQADLRALLTHFRPEVVVHLAAQVSVAVSMQDPVLDVRINVLGSLNVIAAAQRYGVRRIIYASSAACYGALEEGITEARCDREGQLVRVVDCTAARDAADDDGCLGGGRDLCEALEVAQAERWW